MRALIHIDTDGVPERLCDAAPGRHMQYRFIFQALNEAHFNVMFIRQGHSRNEIEMRPLLTLIRIPADVRVCVRKGAGKWSKANDSGIGAEEIKL